MKTFIDIKEYMQSSREQRRSHLVLEEPCIEIGGDSRIFRGLLAHFLGTTIGGRTCYVCHACNNPRCSNPKHLYWGSPTDNVIDQKESGTWKSGYTKMIEKHGTELTKEIMRKRASSGGKSGGGHNALDDEAIIKWKVALKDINLLELGFVGKLSKKMECSHTHVRRILKKYFPEVKTFQRKKNTSSEPNSIL